MSDKVIDITTDQFQDFTWNMYDRSALLSDVVLEHKRMLDLKLKQVPEPIRNQMLIDFHNDLLVGTWPSIEWQRSTPTT